MKGDAANAASLWNDRRNLAIGRTTIDSPIGHITEIQIVILINSWAFQQPIAMRKSFEHVPFLLFL
jgi:hypothetical protein